MNSISAALIPVAGLGTRFQPFSHGAGKEFLPVLDQSGVAKPIIHLAMEEAVAAGVSRFVFVTSPSRRRNLEAYLAPSAELLRSLEAKGDEKTLNTLRFLAECRAEIVEQPQADGLADAIERAEEALSNQTFFMLLPDDVLYPPLLAKMTENWRGKCRIAVRQVKREEVPAYGMVSPAEKEAKGTFAIKEIVEKPAPEQVVSNSVVIGRYIFTPDIFPAIKAAPADKETSLTQAMNGLAKDGKLEGFATEGDHTRFDCGSVKGWLAANAAMTPLE